MSITITEEETKTAVALALKLANALHASFCQPPHLLAVNDGVTHPSTFMFQCKTIPPLTIHDFCRRLTQYTWVSKEALIMAMIHISKVHRLYPNFSVNLLTIHRLFITSLVVSAKFYDDQRCNNARYAQVGGVSAAELKTLEKEFLLLIDYQLYIKEDDYAKVMNALDATTSPTIDIFALPLNLPCVLRLVCPQQAPPEHKNTEATAAVTTDAKATATAGVTAGVTTAATAGVTTTVTTDAKATTTTSITTTAVTETATIKVAVTTGPTGPSYPLPVKLAPLAPFVAGLVCAKKSEDFSVGATANLMKGPSRDHALYFQTTFETSLGFVNPNQTQNIPKKNTYPRPDWIFVKS